jgi:hypothetical protein
MYTSKELGEHFCTPVPRIKNCLLKAGILQKALKPNLHWEVSEVGQAYICNDKWLSEIIEIIQGVIDKEDEPLIADKTLGVDCNLCEKCFNKKPYYDFFESDKNESGLTK